MAELRLWLSLLKLRVVVLLQVTAIAAILAHDLADRQLLRTMVLGNDPRSWADTLETALVVLLGGSLASGGSMAINMWYDRDIDPLMARTDRRPLPSGELAPGAVLAYGVAVCATGIALLALLATPLAGAVAAFSALFYVLVYTVWLKRRTPQNIVIGGLAGALSPLVGWTAAGGDPLALLPWGMVAIIFLWTPPHFWALTLARPGEYARAGVPMLPVTAGEAATRRHITAYAVALLLASLAIGWQAELGYPYLAAVALLGGRFLQLALALQRTPTEATAWSVFGYSNIYLFLLFGAMVAAIAYDG
uniref:Protoheme IX farnesyltransferase n=1 Tax=uncultured marine group II/III euryarchaeote KM3_164_G07 TaxID=1457918 RepID=A0A075GHF1_9EURY|nr:protoheme IX farnesyltransferase (cyoE) [uncultured marine group II/III euryarchaeote KM3_164_G07]